MANEHLFLSHEEASILAVAVDRIAPPLGEHPGASALGAVRYIDRILGAFATDPPLIWAGGPHSGRCGGNADFERFEALSTREELAWRTRIEGSRGLPEREWNGPVRGWQQLYRDGLSVLGDDLGALDGDEQDQRMTTCTLEFRRLLHEHVCEACYGAPEYGGNDSTRGWQAIRWPGDVQPRGFTDDEVSGRE